MAVRGTSVRTLLDVTRAKNPDGSQARIAEILNKNNEVLDDIPWREGNLITGDRITQRTSLPTAGFRRLNEGVARSKSTARQVDEASALIEANSMIDRKIAILGGNPAQARLDEGKTFIEAMNQTFTSKLFYGNSATAAAEFTGFGARFGSKSGPWGGQIIDAAGASTDNSSIWLINWGEDTVYGLYPKGTIAGLQHMDTTANTRPGPDGYPIGDEVLDASGNPYLAYKDHFEWEVGLAVKDPRHVVRIANIDKSDLKYDQSTGANLQDLMVQALELIQDVGPNCAFYAPRAIRSMLRRQLLNKKNAFLDWGEAAGRKVLMFGEVPIRRVDALAADEARVT